MGVLTSELFTQADPATVKKLEDCATGRPNEVISHFARGAQGAHISRVQGALKIVRQLEPGLGIPEFEVNGVYDEAFANAVYVYKQRRNVRNYANKIDNIIGIKTIRSLDTDAKRRKEEPAPQPATEERVTFRETHESGSITREPKDPSADSHVDALIQLLNTAQNIPADIKHLEQHPYQAGDIDRAAVQHQTKMKIRKDYVLLSVDMEKKIVRHENTIHFGYYEITWDTTRSYRFIYGLGTAGQQVAVRCHVKMVNDHGRVLLEATDNRLVKQPPNLSDP